jgi:phosphoglycolate phosphatase
MRAILFDLDRTLVDVQSFTDYGAALADVEALVGTWPKVLVPTTGWDRPTRACMEVLVSLSGDPRWQEVSDLIERHEHAAVDHSVRMPGLAEALAATRGRPRAVVTLLPAGAARRVLDHHGVDIPTVVPRRAELRPKPAPDSVLEACRLLGVAPAEAVMVGDSTWDLDTARSARVCFVGVTNRGPSEFPPGTDMVADLAELAARLT